MVRLCIALLSFTLLAPPVFATERSKGLTFAKEPVTLKETSSEGGSAKIITGTQSGCRSALGWHGKVTSLFDNGLKSTTYYREGKPHGKFTYWHPNGTKEIELTFQDGKRHGESIRWHENGQKEYFGYYKNDKKHGRFTYWNQTGEKVSEVDYVHGQVDKETVMNPKNETSDKDVKPREDPDAVLIHTMMKPIYDLGLSSCEDLTTLQEEQRTRRIAKAFKKMKRRWKGKRIKLHECLVMDERPVYRTIGKGLFPKRKRVKGVSDIQAILPQFQKLFYCSEEVNAEIWHQDDSDAFDRDLAVEVSVVKRSRVRAGKTADKCSTQILSGRIQDLELEFHCYLDQPSLKIFLR